MLINPYAFLAAILKTVEIIRSTGEVNLTFVNLSQDTSTNLVFTELYSEQEK